MPHDVTPQQLETLLNGLLAQEERLPYSFFVQEQQLAEELGAHLLRNKVGPCSPNLAPASPLRRMPGCVSCSARLLSNRLLPSDEASAQ